MKRLHRALGALSVLICLSAVPLAAAPAAEVITLGESLASALLRVPLEGTVRIDDWPVAPGERAAVALTRFDVYSPEARIWQVGPGGALTEVPRSRLAFFRGQAENDPGTRVFVAVDPDARTFSGFIAAEEGIQEIHPLRETDPRALASEHLIAAAEPLVSGTDDERSWTCDQSGAPPEFLDNKAEASTTLPLFTEAITTLHTATIAVDTDNELINNKFGGNVTTATNSIANLFAAMTIIYERDLLIRLLQGTTFLRTAADPYSSMGTTFDKLQEFGNYWNANNGNVTRASATMLSGRGGSGASGIAWVDVLCNNGSGYNYTQLFLTGTSVTSAETMVVAHEIGHNFGSPHTHCYNPPLDNCYNAEAGCFAGTKSCPTPTTINGVPNVTGTLMSYCHLGGLAGCTTSNVFHPGSVALLQPKIQSKVNVCIFPVGGGSPALTITAVSPASGKTTGGTVVAITGTNFLNGATVTFGGTAASSVTFNSSTRLTATAPAHAAGSVAVVVTNPGGQSATRSPGFFYAPPPAAANFYAVTPCRLLDTRNPNGAWGGPALGASGQRTFTVTGRCGVPSTASAVAFNATVAGPTASGYLSIFPGNAFDQGTTALNYRTGVVRSNNGILQLATDGTGTIAIRNNGTGTTHVFVDVTGYYGN